MMDDHFPGAPLSPKGTLVMMDEEEEAEQRMGRRDSFVDDCNQF